MSQRAEWVHRHNGQKNTEDNIKPWRSIFNSIQKPRQKSKRINVGTKIKKSN